MRRGPLPLSVMFVACTLAQDSEDGRGALGDDDWADGEYSDMEAPWGGEAPEAGEPCDRSECLGTDVLQVCTDGSVVGEADCAAHEGTCSMEGTEPHCEPVGWSCRTGCIDMYRRQICWADLSVTEVDCEVLGPDLFCNDSPGPDASCGTEPPEVLLADLPEELPDEDLGPRDQDDPEQDPEQGEEQDQDPDVDPVQEEGIPDWYCPPESFGTWDGCDCGCGRPDPDCDDPDQEVYGCEEWEWCSDGQCVEW